MTKKLALSRGKVALVDDEDFERLMALGKWTFHGEGYAYRWDRSVKPNKCLLLHRVIMNPPPHKEIDHINKNKLDNRKRNLRIVGRSANNLNRITEGVESSKYWSGYVIRIGADGFRHYFGRFKDKEEAMLIARDIKRQLLEAIL